MANRRRRRRGMKKGSITSQYLPYDEYGQTDRTLGEEDADLFDMPDEPSYAEPEYLDPGEPEYEGEQSDPEDLAYEDAAAPSMLPGNDMSNQAYSMLGMKRQQAIDQLNAARDSIMQSMRPKNDERAKYLAIAQGLLSPTRTGSFAESIGNASGAAAPYVQKYADEEGAWQDKLQEMDYQTAADQYKLAMKDPTYGWTVGPNGLKQRSLIIDGQEFPIGRELAPSGRGDPGADLTAKYQALRGLGADKDRALASVLGEGNKSNVSVQMGASFEKRNEINAADNYKTLQETVTKSRDLANKLALMESAIQETPDAYFGPAGPGLMLAAQVFNQLGFDVGDGLDNAEFVQGLAANLGPAQRVAGSGASSDKDVTLFMQSIPSLTTTKEGNLLLIKYYKKLAAYNQKLAKIAKDAQARGDFYSIDDLSAEEINKAGRMLTDDELVTLTPYLPGVAQSGDAGSGITTKQNPDGTITIKAAP